MENCFLSFVVFCRPHNSSCSVIQVCESTHNAFDVDPLGGK